MNKLVVSAVFFVFLGNLSAQEKDDFKVISYNIWNGFTGKDTTREARFIRWVKDKQPDVLALQELTGFTQERLQNLAVKWGHNYAYISKESGYALGITSHLPIDIIERRQDNMWHGYLHARVKGYDFFVVHLSPADYEFRLKEANILKSKLTTLKNDKIIVLGDFNALSPSDIDKHVTLDSLKERYNKSSENNKNGYSNLRNGNFDHAVISTFLSVPLIDPAPHFMNLSDRYSFPAPALIGIWQSAEQVERDRRRIDYIMISPSLENSVKDYIIFTDKETGSLSDHYPVQMIFNVKKP